MARPVSTDDARSPMTLASRVVDFVLSGLVAAAFCARFYLPTEATAQGETLWIVGLWLVIGIVATLAAWRSGGAVRQLDWLDAAVLLLIGGQAVSAVVVVATMAMVSTVANRHAVSVGERDVPVGLVRRGSGFPIQPAAG